MAKTINVKPVEKILIKLSDKEYVCSFNMLAMAYMQEELCKLDCNLDEVSPAKMASLVLYSGIRSENEEFTMEEAVALAINMGAANYGEIMKIYNESVYDSMNDQEKAQVKKMTARYIANVKK